MVAVHCIIHEKESRVVMGEGVKGGGGGGGGDDDVLALESAGVGVGGLVRVSE